MIKHQMRIIVRKPVEKPISIAKFKRVLLIKRMVLKWFGAVEKVMVIVFEKNVKLLEIRKEESDEVFENTNQGKPI